jgi:hypothetical protein
MPQYSINHAHDDHPGMTISDYYPLTKQEIAELLQYAQIAWRGSDARTLVSIQRRLEQGIVGQQCPMPDEGPVDKATNDLDELFVSRKGHYTDFGLVDALYAIMQGGQ